VSGASVLQVEISNRVATITYPASSTVAENLTFLARDPDGNSGAATAKFTVKAADAAANWSANCASCHAKDGSGSTLMGKKNGVKDYRDAKVQAEFTDEKATQAIKDGITDDGKIKMKSFKEKLTDDEVKDLVAFIRKFKP